MSHSTLIDRLGDLPHAYLPKSIALNPELSDGAIVLYTTLAALGNKDGGAAVPQGELADMIGVSRRSILTWTKQLESLEDVGVSRSPGRLVYIDLGRNREDVIREASFARVPLVGWHNSNTWTMPMRRAWVAIWAYCGNGYGCFVGVQTLAEKCGRQSRSIQRTLGYLSKSGLILIWYHRRMSSDISPFDGRTFLEPKYRSRQPVKQTTDLNSQGVKQTSDQEPNLRSKRHQPVKQMTLTCEANVTQPVKQTSPYQESLTVSNRRYNTPETEAETEAECATPFVDAVRRRRARRICSQSELGEGEGGKEGEVLQAERRMAE